MDNGTAPDPPERTPNPGYFRPLLALLLLGALLGVIGLVQAGWILHLDNLYPGALRSVFQANYRPDPRDLRFAPLAPEIVEEVVRDRAFRSPPSPATSSPRPQPTLPATVTPTPLQPSSTPPPTATQPTSTPSPSPSRTAGPSPTPGPHTPSPSPSPTRTAGPSLTPVPTPSATATPTSTPLLPTVTLPPLPTSTLLPTVTLPPLPTNTLLPTILPAYRGSASEKISAGITAWVLGRPAPWFPRGAHPGLLLESGRPWPGRR